MHEKHILIVDDDVLLRKTLCDILRIKGYMPVAVGRGKQALAKIKEEVPAVVLIDLWLEDMTGLEVLGAIKQQIPDTECIVLTGHASQSSAIEAINLGAYSYVQKPYDIDQLLMTIQRAVEKRKTERALQQSEEKYRMLVENTQDIIYALDRRGNLTYISPQIERYGYRPDELLSRSLWEEFQEVLVPADRAKVIQAFEQIAQGKELTYDFRVREADGHKLWFEDTAKPQYDTEGNIVGVIGVMREITERKQAEEALRQSERKWRELFENVRDGWVSTDMDGVFQECNRAYEEMLGYTQEELRHLSYQQLTPKKWHTFEEEVVQERIIKRGYSGIYEKEYIRKDGTVFPVELSSHLSRDEDSEPQGMWGLARDITERKLAEQALQRRNRDLTVLNRVISAAAATLDPIKILRVLCHELAQAFDLPQAAATVVEQDSPTATVVAEYCMPGRPSALGIQIPLSQPAMTYILEHRQPLFIAQAQKDPRMGESRAEMQRRGTVSLLLVPVVVRDRVFSTLGLDALEPRNYSNDDLDLIQSAAVAAGQALEAVNLHQELQEHAEALEAKVAKRTAELREALRQTRAADEAKSQFISNVSHELRTPLTSIRLYLGLLESGHENQRERYLESLFRETERLQTLIEGILTISRLDLGKTRARLKSADLNRLLATLVTDRHKLFAERGLKLEANLFQDLPVIFADLKLLEQVATNLLTNAMNYTPPGGEVCLSSAVIESDGRCWVTFSVKDTGPGISTEEQARLFERFYRGAAGRASEAPGTGLGLAISKEIIKLHRGRVTLDSVEGEGSTFTVWLPCQDPAETQEPAFLPPDEGGKR